MDHVSGTERFMELSSLGCKLSCPPRYKAPVQPGVGERTRLPPSDPQLIAGSRPSQVGGPGQGPTDLGSGNLGRCPTGLPPLQTRSLSFSLLSSQRLLYITLGPL